MIIVMLKQTFRAILLL